MLEPFPFQDEIISWSLARDCSAIFADTGLGKALMQLRWAQARADETGGRVLVLAPLAVAAQTQREAEKFGIAGVEAVRDPPQPTVAVVGGRDLTPTSAPCYTLPGMEVKSLIELPVLLIDGERVLVQGTLQALVASRSCPGEWHNVSFEFSDERGVEEWVCTCKGFECRHECRHVRCIDRWAAGLAEVLVQLPVDA